jgi:hypothetical protein
MQNITDEFEGFEPEFDDYSDGQLDAEEDQSGHLLDEEYDDDEIERRRVAYAGLKKNDKIFNNTYTMGYETSEDDEEISVGRAGVNEIKLDSSSPDYNMYDPEKYADHVDLLIVRRDINNFIQSNDGVLAILGNEPEKKKFTKAEMNTLFESIHTGLSRGGAVNVFISPIHVLDSLSSTVSMEYKKIFDMLTYENKETLLLELNSKYGFLDSMGKNFKMF